MEDSVNNLITDLVWPVTEVTRTVGAVAKGDLSQSMALEVDGHTLQGEFLRSAKIVNTMIGQAARFVTKSRVRSKRPGRKIAYFIDFR